MSEALEAIESPISLFRPSCNPEIILRRDKKGFLGMWTTKLSTVILG